MEKDGDDIVEKSVVYVSTRDDNNINCTYSIVQKDELEIIIILKDLECAIFDYNQLKQEKKFKYLLLKHYEDSESAYKDFLKLIGKMCKKSKSSKYFSNHKTEDNRMIHNNFKSEYMIRPEERNEYNERYITFEKFIIENIEKFSIR